MAQFRLEVQAIKRGDGRSAVAAAAYRSASRLHDARLEMVFDYAAKSGVLFSGVVIPEAAPASYGDRETLWNAAERADRRVDSRTAREILISLPHELSDTQRHDLVRAFVAGSLVSQGMIADYAIHRPDAHGDERNHHAHILVTTRAVGAEGFGFKQRAWDNPEAVRQLRANWADIQNLHLRLALGPDAPQVTHLSLAGQGADREPTVHLGPSASGMERRGEPSDRGDTNRAIAERNAERQEGRVAVPALEDRLAQRQPVGDYPIAAIIREFEAIHQSMEREREGWARRRAGLTPPDLPTARSVAAEVLAGAMQARAQAKGRLAQTQARVASGRARRNGLARWIQHPARMIWAKHAELNALTAAQRALDAAELQIAIRRGWLASDAGRAYVAARLGPARQVAEAIRRESRTLDRRIKRADKRIANVARTRVKLMVARELGQARFVAPSHMRLGVEQAVREVDRRVVDAIRSHGPARQQAALTKVAKLLGGRLPGITLEP